MGLVIRMLLKMVSFVEFASAVLLVLDMNLKSSLDNICWKRDRLTIVSKLRIMVII